MEAQESQVASLGSSKAIPIPDEMLTTLGLREGSRVTISLEEGRLILRPASTLHEELEKWRDMVAASGVNLSEAVAEMRREERQLELERDQRLLG